MIRPMAKTHETYVLWLDRNPEDLASLRGSVEQTRRAVRRRFESSAELLQFLVETLEHRDPEEEEKDGVPES